MKKIVVFTGAGISVASGIPSYRDPDGIWQKFDVMEVASTDGWKKNPQKVLDFYNDCREQIKPIKPNQAHFYLAELEKYSQVEIITQNVDDLHEQAGSSKVLHIHGKLNENRSDKNPQLITPANGGLSVGDLASDGGQLRPNIVWFGEEVSLMDKVLPMLQDADILIVVGTSLQVYPAASIVSQISEKTTIYLIDPNLDEEIGYNVVNIKKDAINGLEEFFEHMNFK